MSRIQSAIDQEHLTERTMARVHAQSRLQNLVVAVVAGLVTAAVPATEGQQVPPPPPAGTGHRLLAPEDNSRPDLKPEGMPIQYSAGFEQIEAHPEMTFLVRSRSHKLALTKDEAVLTRTRSVPAHRPAAGEQNDSNREALHLKFEGADKNVTLTGEGSLPGKVYYADARTKGPLAGKSRFERVRYTGLYPGIDAVYYAHDRRLEFDFIVAPHADPDLIRLSLTGADSIRVTDAGDLSIRAGGEEILLNRPAIYQDLKGVRTAIPGGYILRGKHEIAFRVSRYDRDLPLVIDPTISFATYVGTSGQDHIQQIQANSIGDTYVLANSDAVFELTSTQTFPFETPQPGLPECFLTKLANDGRSIRYTVVFGGVQCSTMELTPGQVHLAMVGQPDNYLRTLTEGPEGLPSNLDVLHGDYDFGAGRVDWMRADSNANLYLITYYTPAGASNAIYELQKVAPGGLSGTTELLQPNNALDQIRGLAVDDLGNAYVVGVVNSDGLITPTSNAFQPAKPWSGNDGFLLRVATDGPFQIDYATYLGGIGDDAANDVAFDRSSGHVLVAGDSASPDFWLFPAQPTSKSAPSAFVLEFDLNASNSDQYVAATLMAGGRSSASALTILPGGRSAITGIAVDDGTFPLWLPLYAAHSQGESRPFLTSFSSGLSGITFSTFLNSAQGSVASAPVVAGNGSQYLYAASTVENDDLAGTSGAFQVVAPGGNDVYVHALDISSVIPPNQPPTVVFTPSTLNIAITSPLNPNITFLLECGNRFTCSVGDPDGDAIDEYSWSGPNGFHLPAAGSVPSATVTLGVGSHTFVLTMRDHRGAIGFGTLTVNVLDHNTVVSAAPQTIDLVDPFFGLEGWGYQYGSPRPAKIVFANVAAAGLTWLSSRSDLDPIPPPQMQAGSPPYYYDIYTSAVTGAAAAVCLDSTGMSFANPSAAEVWELQAGVWVHPQNTRQGKDLCINTALPNSAPGGGRMTTIAVFYPQVPATAATRIAGTSFADNSIDGPGGDPRDDASDTVPPTQSAFSRPTYLALDQGGNKLYVSELVSTSLNAAFSRIRRIDLSDPNSPPSTILSLPNGQGRPIALDRTGHYLFYVREYQAGQAVGDQIRRLDLSTGDDLLVAGGASSFSPLPEPPPQPPPPPAPQPPPPPPYPPVATEAFLWLVDALIVDDHDNVFLAASGRVYGVDSATGKLHLVLIENPDYNPGCCGFSQFVLNTQVPDSPKALAFDREHSLLVGGSKLIRLPAGPDGTVLGAVTYEDLGGVPPSSTYPHPFAGDGLPASQAILNIGYQMIVAQDGAVIFCDGITHRVRRIAPGADGTVNGGADEIVETVAGYYAVLSGPNAAQNAPAASFATSFPGDERGLAQDSSGNLLFSTYLGNTIQRIGIVNTRIGTDVVVPIASGSGTTITVTFTGITAPGATTAAPAGQCPPVTGFQFGTDCIDVHTDALYTAPVTVCITSPTVTSSSRLIHYGPSGPEDVTSGTVIPPTLCGTVQSLSLLGIGEPVQGSFPLTVTKSGTGTGTVASTPAGIDCGTSCTADYSSGTQVTLMAAADASSTFAGWSGGGCSGTGPCNVTMNAAAAVTATFTVKSYTLTVTKSGTGSGSVTSSPDGINCGTTCSAGYNWGTIVALTATAGPGSTFAGWSGSGCTGTGSCTVTVSAATSLNAVFNSSTTGGATATTVASSANPSYVAQAVTFTATVSSSGGIPGGTVTFYDGSKILATAVLTNGTATHTVMYSAAGLHTITAKYPGSGGFLASGSTAIVQAVNRYATTTTLVTTPNPSVYGKAVTLTATVSTRGPAVPTGKVTFLNGLKKIGTVSLTQGVAVLKVSTLPVGKNTITAIYEGNSANWPSISEPLTQTVTR